jgi:hypothetical protein
MSGRNRPMATVRDPASYHTLSAGRPAGPRPGSLAQPWRPPARAPAWSPHPDHTWDGVVARSLVADALSKKSVEGAH